MRICRLDAFLAGYDIKFLEFNADSPAGTGYTDILHEGLRTTIDLPRVRAGVRHHLLADPARADRHAARRLRARALGGAATCPSARGSCSSTSPPPPASPSSGSSAPPRARSASALTPRRSTSSATTARPWAAGEPVHLVYRRALLEDLDQSDLVAAARDGRVCIVNPFRARVANNKKLLALLQRPALRAPRPPRGGGGGPADDPVDADPAPGPRDLRLVDDRPALVRRRQPRAARAQAGVGLRRARRRAGHGDRARRWERIIAEHAERADFIVQEYVPVPEEMFPVIEDGHVQMRLKRFNINPFGIGGRYAGSITRISDRAVDQRQRRGRPAPQRDRAPQAPAPRRGRGEEEVLHGHKP